MPSNGEVSGLSLRGSDTRNSFLAVVEANRREIESPRHCRVMITIADTT